MSVTSELRSFAGRVADRVDPPPWSPADRPPLEPHQIPPDGRWDLWLLEAGRGAGKTEACARYFAKHMRAHPGDRGRIVAPTFGDAVEACIEGPSGLLAIDPEIRWLPSAPGGSKVLWPNGSEALVLGTPSPRDVDRLRAGGNRHLDWWEEMAANPQLKDAWTQASMGLRLGEHPHSIASTTPRPRPAYRKIRLGLSPATEDGVDRPFGTAVRSHATIDDNPHSNPEWRANQKAAYEGTTLGRQELDGQLLETIEGALWQSEWILHADRIPPTAIPGGTLRTLALGLDAAGGQGGSRQAMVGAGRGWDNQIYVVHAHAGRSTVNEWLKQAIRTAQELKVAEITVERNHGDQFLIAALETAMSELGVRVPYRAVWVSKDKAARALPVATLYEQRKVTHVGRGLGALDVELEAFTGAKGDASDLVDALVHAVTPLMGYGGPAGDSDEYKAVPYGDYGGVEGAAVPWG